MTIPVRGEVWEVDVTPLGRDEKPEIRPVVIVSANEFNGATGLVMIVPCSYLPSRSPLHVARVKADVPLEGVKSLRVDIVHSIKQDRLIRRLGKMMDVTMSAVDDRLRLLLGFWPEGVPFPSDKEGE